MAKMNRKDFFEKIIAAESSNVHSAEREDVLFKKYANKELPKSHKTTARLNQYAGIWSETQARHLLRRTMFGAKETDVQVLLGKNLGDAVDYLLHNIPPAPDPPVNSYSTPGTSDITGVPAGEPWVIASVGDGTLNVYRRYSYKAWWLGQILNQNLSILEKMVFFWHNHFATQTYVVGDARYSYNHNVLLRTNALGNVKALVKSVTKDPAMLMYLNGGQNTKNNPDENYARELQELFTIGKNNTPNYTEDDVKAASKVLTGWRVNDITLGSFFLPAEHDISDKQFSSFYNNTIIAGQTGTNGAAETDVLIDMIFAKTETAHYLCSKLYRFFVYYNIDADIEANVIAPLAQILIDNDFEIMPVLQTLLKSDHFYDVNCMGCYIKTPLDLLAGTFRTFDITIPSSLNSFRLYALWSYLVAYGAKLGLDLGDPPNVAGWPPFYESPAYYEIWINSSTFPLRLEFTDMMLNAGFNAGTTNTCSIDVLGFTQQYDNAADPDRLIDFFTAISSGLDVSISERDNLKAILLSGQTTNGYWTNAWSDFLANPDIVNTGIVYSRLTALLTTILRLPEHQLC